MDNFEVEFSGVYGRSYFGSGGGWGRVDVENARLSGRKSNGFMGGPAKARVIDPTKPAKVLARGGDNIGEHGRRWSEAYTWNVALQVWERWPDP